MAQPFQFDKAVLQVVADDKQMINTLKKDEALVNRSVAKMQGDLNKLSVSTAGMGAAVGVLGASVAALGAAAGASGNATLQAIAPIGGFVAAVGTMTVAVSLAKAELLGLIVTTKAYVAANVAAVAALAALIAAIIAVRVVKGRAAQKELDKLKELEEASKKSITHLEKELKRRQGIAAITDKIAVAEGRLSKEEARLNELRRAGRGAPLRQLEERVAAESKLASVVAANAAKAATTAKARADAEQAVIRQKQEALNLANQQAAAEQRIVDEINRQHEARAGRFAGQGPTSAAQAERLVLDTLGLVQANQRSAALTTAAFNRLAAQAARFGLDQDQLAKLRQTLGVEAEKPTTRFGAGALAVSGFAATGTKGLAGLSGAERQRAQREEKRTTNSDAIAANTDRLAKAFDRLPQWGAG